jgi:HK97 gp10 family phage protein
MANKLIWKGKQVEAKVIAASQDAVNETNEAAATQARSSAAYRTGELRGGIGVEPASVSGDQIKGKLVARAPHSIFVELGTVNMAAQPFLRPAADNENSKLAGRIKNKLQ